MKRLSKIHGENAIKNVVRSVLEQEQTGLDVSIATTARTQEQSSTETVTKIEEPQNERATPMISMKGLPESHQRNPSNISESFMLSDVKDDNKITAGSSNQKDTAEKSANVDKVSLLFRLCLLNVTSRQH